MSKFDTIRASGEMMPTAMGGSTAMDGKPVNFLGPLKLDYCIVEILFQTNLESKVGFS